MEQVIRFAQQAISWALEHAQDNMAEDTGPYWNLVQNATGLRTPAARGDHGQSLFRRSVLSVHCRTVPWPTAPPGRLDTMWGQGSQVPLAAAQDFLFFLDRVSCSSNCPQTCYVAKDDSEF